MYTGLTQEEVTGVGKGGVVGGMRPPEMHRRRVDHSDAGQAAAVQSGEFVDATPTPLPSRYDSVP
jgi:hypothetical protein